MHEYRIGKRCALVDVMGVTQKETGKRPNFGSIAMNKILSRILGASLLLLSIALGVTAVMPGILPPKPRAQEPAVLACQRECLVTLADALKEQANSLNPRTSLHLAECLNQLADGLSKQSRAARSAAQDLEDTSEALLVWVEVSHELLKQLDLDLELAGNMHTSLTTFSDGSKALEKILEMRQIPTVRKGLEELDEALNNTANDMEELASVTYPRFYWNGKWPSYEWVAVLPRGYQTAEGLRRAAEGLRSANKELETLSKELPRIRRAVESSRKVMEQVRDLSGTIYENRHEIARSRERLADLIEFLAQGLAGTTSSLAEAMRELERMETVASGLHETRNALQAEAKNMETVRAGLLETSQKLRDKANTLEPNLEHEPAQPQMPGLLGALQSLAPGLLRVVFGLAALVCLLLGIRELWSGFRPTA